MKNLKDKITKLLMIPILAVGLNSCRDKSNDFCKEGEYHSYRKEVSLNGNGRTLSIYKKGEHSSYTARASFNGRGRILTIYSDLKINAKIGKRSKEFCIIPTIYCLEPIQDLENKREFLEIEVNKEIPENHPLNNYINLDSLEKIYDYVSKNGEDCSCKDNGNNRGNVYNPAIYSRR